MNKKAIIDALYNIESELSNWIMGEQDRCENICIAEGIEPDEWVQYEDDDGSVKDQPIVYPENAAPELDMARNLILEAISFIEIHGGF